MNIRTLLVAAGLALASLSSRADDLNLPLGNNNYQVFHLTAAAPTVRYPIDVANGEKVFIDVHAASQSPQVTLTDPSGKAYGGIDAFFLAATDAPPLGAVLFEEGYHAQAELAVAGRWDLQISAPGELVGNLTILKSGALAAAAFTSRPSYSTGEPVVVATALFQARTPVTGADVVASLYKDDGVQSVATVTLFDNGVAPDSKADDGLYTGSTTTLPAGHYLAMTTARVASASAESSAQFSVNAPIARIERFVADQGRDTNGDGLFEWIDLQVELTVMQPGSYDLLGRLEVGGMEMTTGKSLALANGNQIVVLPVKTEDIRSFLRKDGPYQIAELALVQRSTGGASSDVVADRRAGIGQTAAYTLGSLQRPAAVVPPGIEASTSDYDNDGLYDLLSVKFSVDLLKADTYVWSGSLQTADGTILGTASGRSYLSPGIIALTVNYAGTDIGESGTDGPYYLRDVAIYGQSGVAAVADEVGATQNYRYTDFEGSAVSFERLVRKVQELVITGNGGKPRGDGIRTSLLAKLENAQEQFGKGNINATQNILGAFSNEVSAQMDKHISAQDAQELVDLTTALSARL